MHGPALLIVFSIERAQEQIAQNQLKCETESKENEKLSDFQQEIVQMVATLNGDHRKDVYPHKLVETMTVAEGAMYVENAFHKFRHECDTARARGADDSEIVVVAPTKTPPKATSKSFAHKMFSCFVCNN